MSEQDSLQPLSSAPKAVAPAPQLQMRPFSQTVATEEDTTQTVAPTVASTERAQPTPQSDFNFGNIGVLSVGSTPFSQPQFPLSPLQAKLTIGEPNDPYEQEADRVAANVIQQINSPAAVQQEEDIHRSPMQRYSYLNRKISLQRQSIIPSGPTNDSFERSLNQARSGGVSLSPQIKAPIESAMGADFSGVKVHTDSQADQLSQSIQAKAFTTGQDVFFKQGEYNPGSRSGQELIAHELTHVVQQSGGQLQRRIQRDEEPSGRPRSNAIVELPHRPRRNAIVETPTEQEDESTNAFDRNIDVIEDLSDVVAASSGITGDFADVGLTVNTDNYTGNPNTDLSEQGAAKLNNPLCDLGEGANIGLGLVNMRGAHQEWKNGNKGKAVAQGLDGAGHIAHGGAKLAKGLASLKDGAANADWTQVGDSGAAIGDGLGTISSLILTYRNIISTKKKSEEQGGLTNREKLDAAVSGVVNVADITQSGLNTTKDIVKAVTEVGANSEATQQAISNMAQGAAVIGIVVGSIQTIHGAIKVGQGFYNKGQIQKVKQPIREAVLQLLEQDIPRIQESCREQFEDSSTSVQTFVDTLLELQRLKNAFVDLKSFYDQYAPAMDAMSKIENRRMEQGGMKMAQGTVAVASSALLLSGVGAPIAVAIAAIGGILSLSNLILRWRRNKAASRLTKVAAKLGDEDLDAGDEPPAYQEMERRVYKHYYDHLPQVMSGHTALGWLTSAESTDVKNFSWEDKKKRIDKGDHHDVSSLDKVNKLPELTKREHWLQVRDENTKTVTHKEKPKGSSKVKLKTSPSAHKSDAAMGANAETIAIALYALGSGSYNHETEKFVTCPVQPIGDAAAAGIDMDQITGQTSTMLLKVADINEKRWAAWLKATDNDEAGMLAMIKAQVLGKKSPKVKGRGGKGLRDYDT